MNKIKIWINGNEKWVTNDSGIREAVEALGFQPTTVLVEYNGKALWPQEWESETLKENDRLEIFRVSAGG
ncbi:MAG: sulfur carrier protein ThiS [Verrucomicrobiae bacterium]|nr:sulfur carrier protein ThiS [Verrucomicrobiae bacterium]